MVLAEAPGVAEAAGVAEVAVTVVGVEVAEAAVTAVAVEVAVEATLDALAVAVKDLCCLCAHADASPCAASPYASSPCASPCVSFACGCRSRYHRCRSSHG